MGLAIDHIIVCVPDLDQSVREFEKEHGVASVAGGRHDGHGTANRLIPLGDNYIELLAVVDPKQAKTSALGTWAIHRAAVPGADALCLRSDELDEVANRLGLETVEMSRLTPDGVILGWRLAGLRQALSKGLPFFIHWDIPDDLHPGRTEVSHPAGEVRLGDVRVSGDVDDLTKWLEGARGVSIVAGDQGVDFDLAFTPNRPAL